VASLALNRLGESETAAIIARLIGNKELPADCDGGKIVERTDGIPLFVEEMTKAVLEAESEGEARRTAGAVPSPALAVPASLHASLMTRLDRLGLGQGGGADRGGNRAGVLACPAGCGGTQAGGGAGIGTGSSHCGWFAVPTGRAAACDLSLSSMHLCRTRAYGHAAARAATRVARPYRRKPSRASFAEIAERQPELLARHCIEAGLIEKG